MIVFSVMQQYAFHVAPYSGETEAKMRMNKRGWWFLREDLDQRCFFVVVVNVNVTDFLLRTTWIVVNNVSFVLSALVSKHYLFLPSCTLDPSCLFLLISFLHSFGAWLVSPVLLRGFGFPHGRRLWCGGFGRWTIGFCWLSLFPASRLIFFTRYLACCHCYFKLICIIHRRSFWSTTNTLQISEHANAKAKMETKKLNTATNLF